MWDREDAGCDPDMRQAAVADRFPEWRMKQRADDVAEPHPIGAVADQRVTRIRDLKTLPDLEDPVGAASVIRRDRRSRFRKFSVCFHQAFFDWAFPWQIVEDSRSENCRTFGV